MLFLGLGLFELFMCAVLLIAFVVSTAYDRRGNEGAKWLVLVIAAACAWAQFGGDYVLWGDPHTAAVVDAAGKVTTPARDRLVLWQEALRFEFWSPALLYLGAGLIYVMFEFFFGIWRAKNQYAERWAYFLGTKLGSQAFKDANALNGVNDQLLSKGANVLDAADSYAVLFRAADANSDIIPLTCYARDRIDNKFDSSNTKAEWIYVSRVDGSLEIEPKIYKWNLAQWAGAWTLFWPAYGLSLIFGDLLAEALKAFTDFLVYISRRFVKISFAGIFKF